MAYSLTRRLFRERQPPFFIKSFQELTIKRTITEIIIHCSATKRGQDIGVTEIDRWHREQGWLSCGYHYVIRLDGRIENGRPESEAGAHCNGWNKTSIGVCLVGGVGDDGKTASVTYTDKQWTSLEKLINDLHGRYPNALIKGHCDFTEKKTCPNFDVTTWWDALQKEKQS